METVADILAYKGSTVHSIAPANKPQITTNRLRQTGSMDMRIDFVEYTCPRFYHPAGNAPVPNAVRRLASSPNCGITEVETLRWAPPSNCPMI